MALVDIEFVPRIQTATGFKTLLSAQSLLLKTFQWGVLLACFLGLELVFRVRKKVYVVYADIRLAVCKGFLRWKSFRVLKKSRWQVVKAMLDDFPVLRDKVKSYVEKAGN